MAKRRRLGNIGCGLLVLASLFIVVVPCTHTLNHVIRRTTVSHNTKDIVLSLHKYHDVYGRFPARVSTDKHGHVRSWRTLLFDTVSSGYVEGEAWNSPANQQAAKELPHGGHSQLGYVCLAIVGESTMWSADGTPRRMSDAEDGSANTGLVLMLKDTGIEYWEPRDLLFDGKRLTIEGDEDRPINFENAFLGCVGGSFRLIGPEDVDGLLIELLNRNDGKPGREE